MSEEYEELNVISKNKTFYKWVSTYDLTERCAI